MEWALSRAEHLAARRPLLPNRVLLKQNPHNVGEWLTRSQLYMKQGQIGMAVASLQDSLKRVQSNKAVNGWFTESIGLGTCSTLQGRVGQC